MKPGKVLCYMFLFAILGVDRAQNVCSSNQPIEKIGIT